MRIPDPGLPGSHRQARLEKQKQFVSRFGPSPFFRVHEGANGHEVLIDGRRLLALVQSNSPTLEIEPVGAIPVTWNDREWSATLRKP